MLVAVLKQTLKILKASFLGLVLAAGLIAIITSCGCTTPSPTEPDRLVVVPKKEFDLYIQELKHAGFRSAKLEHKTSIQGCVFKRNDCLLFSSFYCGNSKACISTYRKHCHNKLDSCLNSANLTFKARLRAVYGIDPNPLEFRNSQD